MDLSQISPVAQIECIGNSILSGMLQTPVRLGLATYDGSLLLIPQLLWCMVPGAGPNRPAWTPSLQQAAYPDPHLEPDPERALRRWPPQCPTRSFLRFLQGGGAGMLASLTIVVRDAVSGLLSTTSVVRLAAHFAFNPFCLQSGSDLELLALEAITGCDSRRAVM